jgi:rod shape-determining protein MreD
VRWTIFAIFAYVFVVLEVSVRHVIMFADISPSFVAMLVVFIALFAPRTTALWAAWMLGLLVDLNTPLMHGSDQVGRLIGPYALGYPFGCVLILQLRAMLFRRSILTFAVMTTLCVIATSLVVVFIYALHGWYPNEELHWAELRERDELLRLLGVAVYSGVLGLVLGRALIWSMPMWTFRTSPTLTGAWR